MSPQMQEIFKIIADYRQTLSSELEARRDEGRELFELETFANMMTGLQSFRRLPGVEGHMGFEGMYRCESPEQAQVLREYLESVFGIVDVESLQHQAFEFFHVFNEFHDFASEWDGNPNFEIGDLDEESREHYTNSRDFAVQIRDLVGPTGFLAWDCGERMMLIRAAAACGIIDEAQYREAMLAEVNVATSIFDNWVDFAISTLTGSVYYMFVSMGRREEEGLEGFLKINLDIVKRLFAEGIWDVKSWYEDAHKILAIHEENIEALLEEPLARQMCVCSDRILVEGMHVSIMVREEPLEKADSGWRFFAGNEDESYLQNPKNFGTVDLNLVANFTRDIMAQLNEPVGSFFVRTEDGVFVRQDSLERNEDEGPGVG